MNTDDLDTENLHDWRRPRPTQTDFWKQDFYLRLNAQTKGKPHPLLRVQHPDKWAIAFEKAVQRGCTTEVRKINLGRPCTSCRLSKH